MLTMRSKYIDLRVGESITLDGGRIVIELKEKSGQRAKLRVMAQDEVEVERPRLSVRTGFRQAQLGVNIA